MSKKILFILMPQNYRDEEFTIPYKILNNAGFVVDVASWETEVAIGSHGHEHTPNLSLELLGFNDFDDYDALVIPGGGGSTTYLWGNSRIQKITRYFHENGGLVATICYACIVPVEAGILSGKKATVYPTDEAKAILEKYNVSFVDQGVIEESGIITAQGPKFAKEFGEAIVKFLNK